MEMEGGMEIEEDAGMNEDIVDGWRVVEDEEMRVGEGKDRRMPAELSSVLLVSTFLAGTRCVESE